MSTILAILMIFLCRNTRTRVVSVRIALKERKVMKDLQHVLLVLVRRDNIKLKTAIVSRVRPE